MVGLDDNTAIDTLGAALEMHKDLVAMSHCDLFVGSLSSSVAWTVLALMAARHERYAPFVAVERGPEGAITLADAAFHGKIAYDLFGP